MEGESEKSHRWLAGMSGASVANTHIAQYQSGGNAPDTAGGKKLKVYSCLFGYKVPLIESDDCLS